MSRVGCERVKKFSNLAGRIGSGRVKRFRNLKGRGGSDQEVLKCRESGRVRRCLKCRGSGKLNTREIRVVRGSGHHDPRIVFGRPAGRTAGSGRGSVF